MYWSWRFWVKAKLDKILEKGFLLHLRTNVPKISSNTNSNHYILIESICLLTCIFMESFKTFLSLHTAPFQREISLDIMKYIHFLKKTKSIDFSYFRLQMCLWPWLQAQTQPKRLRSCRRIPHVLTAEIYQRQSSRPSLIYI